MTQEPSNYFLNWKIPLCILSGAAALLLLNSKLPVFPVSGIVAIISFLVVWFISVCITFIGLHKLLQYNEPLNCNFATNILAKQDLQPKEKLQPNLESVKRLTADIDSYFISKWYKHVSKDQEFIEHSKHFIETVIYRLLEVQLQVNNKALFHGLLNIYLKHLKEFRRTLKRKEKYNISVEELYRYSHVCSTSSSKPQEYYIHQLTINLLKHFINSELWNSLPCSILVSILSKKLMLYLLKLLSNPDFLNYVIISSIVSDSVKADLKLHEYARIKIVHSLDDKKLESSVNPVSNNVESNVVHVQNGEKEATVVDGAKNEIDKKENDKKDKELETKKMNETLVEKAELFPKVELRKHREPVKIYESKGASRTWRDSRDLACISLGQDPLDALQVAESGNKFTPKSVLCDNAGDATERTFHNIKDLQESTVNNALHKIGDFQDEAAGVVEGLLDFGRAGLRRGLRLTGLQDNIENAKPTNPSQKQTKKKLSKLTRSDSQEKTSSADSIENVWVNPLESPGLEEPVDKEKPRQSDTELRRAPRVEDLPIPSISTEQIGTDSPDLEYEDTADLASSIAKLRSLLQQRSSESNISTPALSPMPDDYHVVEAENISDMEEVDGVMPSFYKFCTKTASGVLHNTLNTIKTALPSNSLDQSANVWKFKSDTNESETLVRIKKLLTERKEYCTIDTEIDAAYEAIDSLELLNQSPTYISCLQFEDELDEFELKVPITKTLVDIFCELLSDTNSPFLQEPLVKIIILSFGNTIEQIIALKIGKLMERLADNLITIPAKSNTNTLKLEMDRYLMILFNAMPELLKIVLGKDALFKAMTLFISSVQTQKINQDSVMQMFELIALKLIEENAKMTPPASA